ncbi:hypothetical protein HGA92_04430 [Candidatus Gracilibacteria bacterium]|nr:hypothetical protein [Candidatus Gracilibacteria bacterium]NUJ98519.1 hypothetical protein [Candidatus Gracilibacteria bacterium]
MQSLKIWEDKIKEKRKSTPWREFLQEIVSWMPLNLYKNQNLISRFPPTTRSNIISTKQFEQERESLTHYGRDYDFEKDFFENIALLKKEIPFPNLMDYGGTEKCEYADITYNTKNVYLSFNSVWDNENIYYTLGTKGNCHNVFNGVHIWDNSSNIYSSASIIKSYNIFFSDFIINSNNIWMSRNLIGCEECIFCEDLENQKYCIENKSYEKEIYFNKKKEILRNKKNLGKIKSEKYGKNFGSSSISGSFIIDSENIINGVKVYQVKEGRNLILTGSEKGDERMYDVCVGGSGVSYDYAGACSSGTAQNIYICDSIGMSSNIYYSLNISDCSFCLGCIGLKNKSFCIFNKQYSKEEWYELADKIFASMEKDGILGDFFPGSLNPFYFNDTMAYLIDDSFTKEEVGKEGFMWRDEKIKVDIPEGAEIVYAKNPPVLSDIPLIKGDSQSGAKAGGLNDYQGFDENGNWKINPEILKKVIIDNDGNYYKIVPMEYDFLMKYGLPLPEVHWLERIKMGFKI